MKEGREGKVHITSSHLRLIGCSVSIQIVKPIHDEMCNMDNVQPLYKLLHGLNMCAKQSKMLIPSMLQNWALMNLRTKTITWLSQCMQNGFARGTRFERPETLGRLCHPILNWRKTRMHRAVSGCRKSGPGRRKPSGREN